MNRLQFPMMIIPSKIWTYIHIGTFLQMLLHHNFCCLCRKLDEVPTATERLHVIGSRVHCVPGSLSPRFIESQVHCVPGSLRPRLYVFATFMQLFFATFPPNFFAKQFATFCNSFCIFCNLFCNINFFGKVAKTLQKKSQQTCKKLQK